jgi:polysaccharide export outer membrane protein
MKALLARAAASSRRIVALTVLLAGCSPDLPPITPYTPGVYRLGVGDQVRIITYGDEQLTDDFRVSDSGTLAMPLLGTEVAAGRTTDELARAIAKDLQAKSIIKDASVSVEVTAYRPIAVLGEVARPGQYPYSPGMTMLTAVAAAGGFTYRAIQGYAEVVRQEKSGSVDGKLDPKGYVAPGDVIKIDERLF